MRVAYFQEHCNKIRQNLFSDDVIVTESGFEKRKGICFSSSPSPFFPFHLPSFPPFSKPAPDDMCRPITHGLLGQKAKFLMLPRGSRLEEDCSRSIRKSLILVKHWLPRSVYIIPVPVWNGWSKRCRFDVVSMSSRFSLGMPPETIFETIQNEESRHTFDIVRHMVFAASSHWGG